MSHSPFAAALVTDIGIVIPVLVIVAAFLSGRRALLMAQVTIGILAAVYFGLQGVAAAAALHILGVMQSGAALLALRYAILTRVGYVLVPIMVAIGIWYWTGLPSGLSASAMVMVALARMQHEELRLRFLGLAASLLWAAHDALIGAYMPLATDILTGLIGLVIIALRFGLPRSRPENLITKVAA